MNAGVNLERSAPSAWVVRFADCVPAGGTVLDVACGDGRHTQLFLQRSHHVVAIDRDTSGLSDLIGMPELEVMECDLESGANFPLPSFRFAGVIVTNYLHRPLLPRLVQAVASGGVLIYETFAEGNERFGRPRNPDFLLKPGELLETVRGHLRVRAYEDLVVNEPRRAAVQRIVAERELDTHG